MKQVGHLSSLISHLSDLLRINFVFQPHHALDFTVNILFSSYNFLGPFIFWLLNPRIRRRADLALYQMVITVALSSQLSINLVNLYFTVNLLVLGCLLFPGSRLSER